jgi:hypothetical protein
MSRFLKLTNFLINVNQIRRIDMPPGAYKIYLMPCEYTGFHFMGSGYITSAAESYTVSEKDHILDYKIVTDWILCEKNNNVWH